MVTHQDKRFQTSHSHAVRYYNNATKSVTPKKTI